MSALHWRWPTDFPLILLVAAIQERLPGVLTKCFAAYRVDGVNSSCVVSAGRTQRHSSREPLALSTRGPKRRPRGERGRDASVPKKARHTTC